MQFELDVLNSLSCCLVTLQIAKNTVAKWISDIPYFKGCQEDFIILLSLNLHPETFTPKEKLISLGEDSDRLYVVRQVRIAG